jgi:hypothetical protein
MFVRAAVAAAVGKESMRAIAADRPLWKSATGCLDSQ